MPPDHEIDESGTAHGQLATRRRILTADELCRLKDARPRFEKEIRLPGDSRGTTNTVFMFSIDGMLDGEAVIGALFAGECMLVQARSLKMAERIAKEGLQDTARFALAEYEDRTRLVQPATAAEQGLTIEGGGRKAASEDPELLRSDPLMKKILASEIGGIKWKH